MVPSIVSSLVLRHKEKGIDVNIDCPEDIRFTSNPRLVEVILSNLVENAVYYGSIRRPDTAKVILRAAVIDDTLEFSIEDNGIGIKEEIKPRLFDMFFNPDYSLLCRE